MRDNQELFKRKNLSDEDMAVLAALLKNDAVGEDSAMKSSDVREWTELSEKYATVSGDQLRYRLRQKFNRDHDDSSFDYVETRQPNEPNASKRAWLVARDEVQDVIESYEPDLSVSKYPDIESAFRALVDRIQEIEDRTEAKNIDDLDQRVSKLEDDVETIKENMQKLNNNFNKLRDRL